MPHSHSASKYTSRRYHASPEVTVTRCGPILRDVYALPAAVAATKHSGFSQRGCDQNPDQPCTADGDDDDDNDTSNSNEIWGNIATLRMSYYGSSMWCIGWNIVAIFLTPGRSRIFVPALIIGVSLSAAGCYAQRLLARGAYRDLFKITPICIVYIVTTLFLMLRIVIETVELYERNTIMLVSERTKNYALLMLAGDFLLMSFVCCSNTLSLTAVCAQVGAVADSWVRWKHRNSKKQEHTT